MDAFVITMREGIEAALVLGLILGYLNRMGLKDLKRYVYTGLALAIAASLVGALVFSLIGFEPENEVLEGALLAAAAVLVASLVVWMWRASRGIKRHVDSRLEALTGATQRRRGWGLLSFTFFMVFREGVEIVLFLAALSLTQSSGLVQVIGGISGLALVFLFGFLLIKGSVHFDLKLFFRVTGVVLLILVVRLAAGSLHEFSEVGVLPSTPLELQIIGFIVKDATSIVILLVLMLIPILAILPGLRIPPEEKLPRPGETPADRRKRIASLRRSRLWGKALVAIVLAMAVPLSAAAYKSAVSGYRPEPVELAPQDEAIRIPMKNLETGKLHKFLYRKGGEDVRFIVIKRSENDIAAAMDACRICPPLGYYQEGETIICDNCNAPINLATVGMPGGCNPIPLQASITGAEIVIEVAVLEAGDL
ncbi:MAG: Fe-S-containing protein [Spirochaetota bacterium]